MRRLFGILAGSLTTILAQQGCDEGQCFPAVGDLLIGRGDRLSTNSTCGEKGPSPYCIVSNTNGQGSCFECDSRREWDASDRSTWDSHRVQNIIMSRAEYNPNNHERKWWQSVNGEDNVYIQLDLEAQFSFTHLIMTFKTFRPAAMVVKRSSDFGQTWKPYRYFAEDCTPFMEANPDIAPGPVPDRIDQIICDHTYNKKVPSQDGEIVLKVLEPQLHDQLESPYSDEVMELLKVTNIRIEFLKLHTLGDDHIDSSMGTSDSSKKYYYALYNLVLRGSCFCYGHASSCRPLNGDESTAAIPGMVHGQCRCEHHTTGMNCEQCEDFYHDAPWRPAKEDDTSECRRCNCHGHSTKCHFDQALWEATGHISGGHCDECQHNTEGYHCERCKPGYFHDPAKDLQDEDMCVACDCDPEGTTNGGICDHETHPDKGTVAGKCHCKANVTGPRCDQCKPGYHSLSADNPEGCTKCECNADGGVLHQDTGSPCDPDTGLCYCKRHVVGDKCDSCMPGTYGLKATDGEGCKACGCDVGGSILENGLFECNHLNGQCHCRQNLEGRQCSQVADGAFLPPISQEVGPISPGNDYDYSEISQRITTSTLDIPDADVTAGLIQVVPHGRPLIDFTIDPTRNSSDQTTTPFGQNGEGGGQFGGNTAPLGAPKEGAPKNPESYTEISNIHSTNVVMKGSTITFQLGDIPRTMFYQFSLRYKPQTSKWANIKVDIERPDQDLRNSESMCYNTQPANDHWEARLPLEGNPTTDLIESDLTKNLKHTTFPCLETNDDKGTNQPYNVSIYFTQTSDDTDEDSYIIVDSLIVRGYQKNFPIFNPEVKVISDDKRHELETKFSQEQCLKQELAALEGVGELSPFCEKLTYTISAWLYDGAQSCDCNKQGSTSLNCNPKGGQCDCRPGVTGRQCDQCHPGFYGFSANGCTACKCNTEGTVNANQVCDTAEGKCQCKPGVGGRDCSQCLPGYWGFPNCQKCECNGHSNVCDQKSGQCTDCAHNTKGEHCEECADGYYGNARLISGEPVSCTPCPCPEGPGSGRQFASSCHRGPSVSRYDGEVAHSLICVCDEGYTGEHCDQCAPGYFGNPHEKGGSCAACECNGRIDTNDPDACNASTGVCEKCLYNRASPDCVECADGYYEENGECVPCLCDGRGSTDAVCDKRTGQCPCLSHVTGRTCNSCVTNFYDLNNAKDSAGCKACACDPHNSVNPATACDEYTGQCECKPEFGGRDCSTCQNGHWGDPAHSDCKDCECDPLGTDPNAENQCDPFTGQCACIEGVGELQCNKCARGYHGDVPECEPCGECFTSWDNIIQELIGETTEVLAQVNTIQEKGVSVVYDSQFDKIEQFLNRARAILESEEGMIMLQKTMTSIESKNQNGRTRLDDIYGSLDEIGQTNGEQNEQLEDMKRAIKDYEAELASLKKALDEVADKDPVVMWSRIAEMADDATKFEILAKKAVGYHGNPNDNPLAESARIRGEVEEAIPLRQKEFEDASRELGNMIDDTEGLNDLVIGEINELVCGVNTEGCDPTCGGAECQIDGQEHCGNPDYSVAVVGEMCQSSGYQTAIRAQAHAYDADKQVQHMRDQVDKALEDTEPIRKQSKEAHDKAVKVNDQAKKISGEIAEYQQKISELVDDIRNFLQKDEHTNPANILDIAQQVLNLQMPPQSEIDELKAKMAQLGMDPSTDDDEDDTGANFAELNRIQIEASDVLNRARELAKKVDSALKHYGDAENNCNLAKEHNTKAQQNSDLGNELHGQVVESVEKLKALVENLDQLVNKEDGISEKVKKINRKIIAIQGNERNSTQLSEAADKMYDVVKADYDLEKEKDTFKTGEDFTIKVEDLRLTQNKAFRLQDNVKQLMEEVKAYKKEWEELQNRHKAIKAEVDSKKDALSDMKNQADSVREAIHKKLYNTEACSSTGQ